MKNAKKILALLLAVCMLIGLPMAVQANDSAEEFKVVKVVELPANKATAEMPAGRTVLVYFNNTPSDEALSITGFGLDVNIRISATGKDLTNVDINGTIVASYGKNPIAVTFGNNTANNMHAWREAGYTSIELYFKENGKGTASDKGQIKGFTDVNGQALSGETVGAQAYESIYTAIISEPFQVVKVEELHDNYATDVLLAGRTVLVYFNNTPSADALTNTGFGKRTNIRINVTGDGLSAININGEIVTSYGTNPIAVTFGNNTTNNFPAWRAAGYDTFELGFKEYNETVASSANLGWIEGFVDVNGTALTGVNIKSGVTEEVRTVIDGPRYVAAKIGEIEYESLDAAMDAAVSGNTVKLFGDAAVTDAVFVLDSGVKLDLNGYELTVNNMMAFGQVVDSTEGEGKLVVAKTANTILLSDNEALPMYDEDGYRFFSYELVAKGCHVVTEGSVNQYGVSIIFKDVKAYELLAAKADTCGVKLYMDMKYDGKHDMNYKFRDEFIKTYAQACVDVMNGGNSPAKKTIILTISGLNGKSLEVDSVINALPYGEAHIVQNRVDNNTLSAGPTA